MLLNRAAKWTPCEPPHRGLIVLPLFLASPLHFIFPCGYIYIYTYLESLIFPQNSHRCSCEVPPQPTFKNLPSLYAVYTDINCNRQDSHQHIFVFVSHPQLCQGHLWGPQLCFHCSKWRDALYCCYCFKADSMSSLCHAPLCCQCTARSIYYWGKIIDGVLSPSSHLHVFKSHSFTVCFCRRFEMWLFLYVSTALCCQRVNRLYRNIKTETIKDDFDYLKDEKWTMFYSKV